MRKLILSIVALMLSAVAFAADFGNGMTFKSGDATLDFYNRNNKVVYHTNGAGYSHTGEWSDNGSTYQRGVRTRGGRQLSEGNQLTVKIYLSGRVVEWTGSVNYSNGRIVSVTLNGQTWYRE